MVLFEVIAMVSLLFVQEFNLAITRIRTVLLVPTLTIFIFMGGDKKNVKFYLNCILLGTLVLLIMSIQGFDFGFGISESHYNRMGEVITDSNFLGLHLAISATISLYTALGNNGNKKYYACFAVCAIFVLFTQSRSGILLLTIFSIIVLTCYRDRVKRWKKLIIVFLTITIILSLSKSGLFADFTNRIWSVLSYFKTKDATNDFSTYSRIMFKKIGIEYWLQRPLFGYGIGQSNYILNGTYFHDNAIQLLVETGIIGCLSFYYPFYRCFRRALKKRESLILILLAFVTISGIFNTFYYHKFEYIVLGICMLELNDTGNITKCQECESLKA